MAKRNWLEWVVFILVIVGAVNIGLATLGLDVLGMIFGGVGWLMMLINILIGLSGLYLIWWVSKN